MRMVVTGASGSIGTSGLEQLGWTPRHSVTAALEELLVGMRGPAGVVTPPLDPRAGGPLRIRELLTGVGRRTWG